MRSQTSTVQWISNFLPHFKLLSIWLLIHTETKLICVSKNGPWPKYVNPCSLLPTSPPPLRPSTPVPPWQLTSSECIVSAAAWSCSLQFPYPPQARPSLFYLSTTVLRSKFSPWILPVARALNLPSHTLTLTPKKTWKSSLRLRQRSKRHRHR